MDGCRRRCPRRRRKNATAVLRSVASWALFLLATVSDDKNPNTFS
jgi:hypothetical protein